jgi:uncharacterized protein (TIGR03435 family)
MSRPGIEIIVGLLIVGTISALHATRQESAAARTQSAGPASGPTTFDVVSVRPNRSGTNQGRIDRTPTGVTIINHQLRVIVQLAYGISQPSRLVGLPSWNATERFDVVARGAINGIDDFRAMMQAMLADRFKLSAHVEQRSIPIYSLVLARRDRRLGPSLKASTLDCGAVALGGRGGRGAANPDAPAAPPAADCGLRSGPGEIDVRGVSIDQLTAFLSIAQGRPVVDNTGLTGNYDFHLMFAPDPFPGRAPDPSTDGRPTLVTALQEQLGLKLEGGKQLQDVLVIDSVSRPDEN